MGLGVPLLTLLLTSIGAAALAVAGCIALSRRRRGEGDAVPGPPVEAAALRIERPIPAMEPCQEVSDEDIVPEPAVPTPFTVSDLALAVKAALGPLLADAASATSLLRMSLPTGTRAAEEHVARIEGKLREAEVLLAAFAAPVPPPALEAVHADRLLSDAKHLGLDVREVERFIRTGREAMSRRDQATALKAAQEARERLTKALPSFVEDEMKKARNVLLDLKMRGGDLSKPIGILKAASIHAKKEDWGAAIRYLREFRREVDAF